MTDLIKVEGQKNLARDVKTKAVINTSVDDFANAKIAKQNRILEKQKLNNLENRIENIEQALFDILAEIRKK